MSLLSKLLKAHLFFPRISERFVAHPETTTARNNPSSSLNDASYSCPITSITIERPPVLQTAHHATTYIQHRDPTTASSNAETPFSHPDPASAFASTPSSSNVPLPGKLAVALLGSPPSLIDENSPGGSSFYARLHHAAVKGDWKIAEELLRSYPGAVNVGITMKMETLLHIAAGAGQTMFVKEVVSLMSPAALGLKNDSGDTALFYAASSGVTRIAEVMVQKNIDLLWQRNDEGFIPLQVAALRGHREMVWYLYRLTRTKVLRKEDYVAILFAAIKTDLFDVALEILQGQPELATAGDLNGMTALHILAMKPSAFPSESSLTPWHRILYHMIHVEEPSQVHCCLGQSQNGNNYQASSSLLQKLWHAAALIVPGTKVAHATKLMHIQALRLVKMLSAQPSLLEVSTPMHPLLVAAKYGTAEVVTELMNSYPDIIWKFDQRNQSIFHISVMYRQEKIFNLMHKIGEHSMYEIASYKDQNGQNLLHLAGKPASFEHLHNVRGAALQMQRELLWFKEVEKTVPPLAKQEKDNSGMTPRELFNEAHKDLVKEGKEWMKSRASSCMLVATVITTVMFPAILTVPWGNDNNKGTPIFLKSNALMIFAMSDAFALTFSVTSNLVFLSLLISHYAEEDFLGSLPKRLIVGLITLFLSIVSMLVAYGATFLIVLGHRVAWIVVPIALVASVPVTLFAILQFPLLAEMFHSCYGPGIFARERRNM